MMDEKTVYVEILRYPTEDDWKRCKMLAMNTVGKYYSKGEVSTEWKRKIIEAEHSPIRTLIFTIRMEIPYYVSVHFVRHKHGVEHYVSSQRNDRQNDYDRNAARQDALVSHIMEINAAELIYMARRRLCHKADPMTREIMGRIKSAIYIVAPEIADAMLPDCMYRKGCHEYKSCGAYDKIEKIIKL